MRLPGVEAAGAISHLPLSGKEELDGFSIEGRTDPIEASLIQTADFRVITPDYFRAMRIPLLKGRFFNEQDRASTTYSAIIDESFARRFFPGEDPLGKRIDEDGSRSAPWFRCHCWGGWRC